MLLIEATTVPQSALPVAEFKDHLRLGTGFSDDGLQDPILIACLRAALASIEANTGKILIERDFIWTLPNWRNSRSQALPVAPVSAVASMTLVDRDGAEADVEAGTWQLVPDMVAPRVVPVGAALPVIPQYGQVRIAFLAGFGPEFSDVPLDLAQAVLILAAYFYENRHGVMEGGDLMPPVVSALIAPHRPLRLGARL